MTHVFLPFSDALAIYLSPCNRRNLPMKKLLTLTLGLLLTSIVAVAQSKLDCAMVPNADVVIAYSGKANDAPFIKQCQALSTQVEQEEWYKKRLGVRGATARRRGAFCCSITAMWSL